MDPEQTAPIGAVCSGSTLFAIEASETFQQTRKAGDFCCDLRIKVNTPITSPSYSSPSILLAGAGDLELGYLD